MYTEMNALLARAEKFWSQLELHLAGHVHTYVHIME
jgi:hypothetical protein